MYRISFIFLLILLVSQTLKAQQKNWVKDGVEDTEFVIEKERENKLPEASRNFDKIIYSPKPTNAPRLSYQWQETNPFKVSDVKINVSPVNMDIPRPEPLLNNYVKAGFGNYTTPYFDLFLGSGRNEQFQYFARYNHLSSQTGEIDGENSGTAQNRLNLGATYFSDKIAVGGDAQYLRNRFYFYGYNPEQVTISDNESIKQILNDFELNAFVKSIDDKSALQFKVGAGYATISDNYQTAERLFTIPIELQYQINEKSRLQANLATYLTRRTDSTAINRNFVGFTPRYFFDNEKFALQIGANVVYENDTISNTNNFHIYPHVQVGYHFSYDFTLFAGVTGNMERTSYRQFVNENPFLAPEANLIHSNKQLEFFGGIKGNITPQINFTTQVSFATYQNLYFYLNSPLDSTKFVIAYNDKNTNVLTLTADINYNVAERFRTGLKVQYFGYSFEDDALEAAWHRPNLQAHLLGAYNFNKKLYLNADLQVMSGIEALEVGTGEKVTLDTIMDLSLKADYWFSEKFSAFLSANNLISSNYQRYLNYPVRRLNFLAGVTYAF